MRRPILWCGSVACAALLTTGIATAALTDVPEALRPTVACMIDVLGADSHIDHVDAGVTMASFPSIGPQTQHAYVEYHTMSHRKDDETVRFLSRGPDASSDFGTYLPGLVSSVDEKPDDDRTDRVMRLWRSKCGVNAWVLYT